MNTELQVLKATIYLFGILKKRLKEDDLRMAIYSLRASSPGRSAFLAPLLIRPRGACSRAR